MEDKSFYGGFWKRFAAYLLDGLILGFSVGLVMFIALFVLIFTMKLDTKDQMVMGVITIVLYAVIFLAHILYFAFFESSAKQATPGKLALGIVVTNMSGGRISFWRAVGRNVARYLSGLFLGLGYIICGFTDKRQTVHDLICSTLVVKNDAPLRLGNQEQMQIMQTPDPGAGL